MRNTWRAVGVGLVFLLAAACGSTSNTSGSSVNTAKGERIALLIAAQSNAGSVAVEDGVQETAKAQGADVDVLDAGFDAQKQFSQMQDAITTGKYKGILVQPVDGASICSLVPQAVSAGITVGAVNSAIGTSFTSPRSSCQGVAVSVLRPFSEHGQVMGELTKQACQQESVSSCAVGFLRTAPGAPFDAAIYKGFEDTISGTNAKIVAEGNSMASREGGLTAIQQMLAAHPDINVLVGPEQSLLGGLPSIKSANLNHKVLLVGIGGTTQGIAAVKDGTLYGVSFSAPRSEGKQAMQDMLKAIKTGKPQAAVDVVKNLPNGGLVDRKDVDQFKPEFDG